MVSLWSQIGISYGTARPEQHDDKYVNISVKECLMFLFRTMWLCSCSNCFGEVLGDESLMKSSLFRSLYLWKLSVLLPQWHVTQHLLVWMFLIQIQIQEVWGYIGSWSRMNMRNQLSLWEWNMTSTKLHYPQYTTIETLKNQHLEFHCSHFPQKFIPFNTTSEARSPQGHEYWLQRSWTW